jgi:hypothetical protein
MKAFNPTRYASLSWANPLSESDPQNCTNVAADSARTTENGLIWDMLRQVGAWVKSRERSNPLTYGQANSTAVQRFYAWGYSQSGNFLMTYLNAIHPLDVRALGKPLFDAYFIAVPGGLTAIHQCAQAPGPGDARRRIASAGIPVMRVVTLSEYLRVDRRPDSDAAPDLFRHYEIAGAAHATPDELTFAAAPADIVKAGIAVPPMECNEGPRSRFPNSVAFNAALRNLDEWVRTAPDRLGPSRSRWQTASRSSTRTATSRAACARPTLTCPPAGGVGAPPARRSVSLRGTRSRSHPSDCGCCI